MLKLHGYFTLGRCVDCGRTSLVYVTKVDAQGNEYGNSLYCFDESPDAEEGWAMLANQFADMMKRYRILELKEADSIPKAFKEAFRDLINDA